MPVKTVCQHCGVHTLWAPQGGMFEGDDGFLGHTSCVNKVTLVVSLPALIIYSVTEVVVMF